MLKNLLIFVTSIIISLFVAEAVVRHLKLAPDVAFIEKWRMRLSGNPKIGYEPIPNFDSRGKSQQYHGFRSVTNGLGFRGKDYQIQKNSQNKRVIVLGDSIVEGLWIDEDKDVYPAILEQSFGKQVEVLNFGVSGYNTEQEVATLQEKGLAYSPDLVILNYCLNDRYTDNGGIVGHLKVAEKNSSSKNIAEVPPLLRTAIQKSALLRFLRYRVFESLNKSVAPEEDGDDAFGTVEESFKLLSAMSSDDNFLVMVVFFPNFNFFDRGAKSYDFFDDHRAVEALAKKYNVHFLDLFKPMEACKSANPDLLLSFDKLHPRPHGNACAANAIKDFIESKNLLN